MNPRLLINLHVTMGAEDSKTSNGDNMIANLLADYHVIQRVPEQTLLYLQHKNTHEECLLREFNFTDKKACDNLVHRLMGLKSKLKNNRHVVELQSYGVAE